MSITIAALSMYILCRILNYNVISSIIASLAYASSPWFYRIIAPEGAFPRALGYALIPLVLATIVYTIKNRGLWTAILASLSFSMLILVHHSIALLSCILIAIICMTVLLEHRKYIKLKNALCKLLIFIVFTIGITFFWITPFLIDLKLASFIPEASGFLLKFYSVELESLYVIQDG